MEDRGNEQHAGQSTCSLGPCSLLRHPHFQTNLTLIDLHSPELGLGKHRFELLPGISALDQHGPESELGHDPVETR